MELGRPEKMQSVYSGHIITATLPRKGFLKGRRKTSLKISPGKVM